MDPDSRAATRLAQFLAVAGTMHFVVPKFYDAMIPSWLPGTARQWTQASGLAEIAVAATVANKRTRRAGGAAATALFIAVFPGNVKMTVDAYRGNRPGYFKRGTVARLPMQIPLVVWAERVRRTA